MQSLLFLFKKNTAKSVPKTKACKCVLYDDLGCSSRALFDEDFPTSSALQATLGHSFRGVRLGVDSSIECRPDGSVFASATPEIVPSFGRFAAKVDGSAGNTRATLIAGVCHVPKLPGFCGELAVSNKTEYGRLKTQYRHKNFSVVSDNALMENYDISVGLNTVGCCCAAGLAGGIDGKMKLKKSEGKKFSYECGLESLDGRISFIHGPWSIFLESANFGKDYQLSMMRKMLVPHFTNEMIIAARISAHAALPELADTKTIKEKASAINAALVPKATFAVRTKLTDSSSAKIKVDTKGMVGFSFAEQLSQFAHAVFAINVDATKLTSANNHKFAFILTLEH